MTNAARSTNVNYVPIANGKSLFVVVNGQIRKRKSDGRIDFTHHVNIQLLLDEQAN